jgi:hypothetical protein
MAGAEGRQDTVIQSAIPCLASVPGDQAWLPRLVIILLRLKQLRLQQMLSAKMGSAGLATGTRLAKGLLTAIAAANTVGAVIHVITAP